MRIIAEQHLLRDADIHEEQRRIQNEHQAFRLPDNPQFLIADGNLLADFQSHLFVNHYFKRSLVFRTKIFELARRKQSPFSHPRRTAEFPQFIADNDSLR